MDGIQVPNTSLLILDPPQLETATADARAATILHGLGFSMEMMEGRYSALSGGWRSRCSLATALLVQSDLVLLDEVTNFLGETHPFRRTHELSLSRLGRFRSRGHDLVWLVSIRGSPLTTSH